MIILDAMLLVSCLVYGWIIAKIFGGNNFQNVWIWSTFILFILNHSYYKINLKRHRENNDKEE
jgi:hypothetical protein